MKYICELCGMIYDEEQGSPRQGIAPGTPFSQLSDDYDCPGCGSKKEAYYKAEKSTIQPKAKDQAFWNEVKYSDHRESDK